MKALLKKDWYLMKDFKKVMILIMVFVIFVLFTESSNITFILSYMTLLSSMMVVNTLSLDEEKNGNAFLFTLPVSRKEYVTEKYIFGILIGILGWLVAVAGVVGVAVIKHLTIDWKDLATQGIVTFVILFMILAVAIPIQIKFGTEKGRIILIVSVMAVFFGGVSLLKVLQENGIIWTKTITELLKQKWIGIAGIAAVIVIFICSILYSIQAIKKKEY